MVEILTLVDENDNVIGTDTRENCHLGDGKLHRALVIFLFDDNMLLIQQRSQKKLLWPGYWDCSLATHVYPNETYESASERRLKQELGIKTSVKKVFGFVYHSPFNGFSEREYCALLTGNYKGKVYPNKDEISAYGFVNLKKLKEDITRKPEMYTPWFKIAFEKFSKYSI
jgi:isopentenyl-diphosphate delta-isomerase